MAHVTGVSNSDVVAYRCGLARGLARSQVDGDNACRLCNGLNWKREREGERERERERETETWEDRETWEERSNPNT